jgi:ferredoxin-nitrite reductase
VAGIDRAEIIDATSVLLAVSQHLTNNREFSNLPRKFKISISGCRILCSQPDINCVGVFGLERQVHGKREAGFGIKVGGGLSSAPLLAQTLPVFLRPEEVLPVVHYTSVIYRDFGFRDRRNRARFKFLVADWGVDKVLAKIEALSGRAFQRHSEFLFPTDPESDHLGVHEQKQAGMHYVGVCVAGGRVRGAELRAAAELSKRYAQPDRDRISTTNKQNLLLLNIPEGNLPGLQDELSARAFSWQPSNYRSGCVSCTGIEFCNLALAETKNRMMTLVEQLEAECAGFQDKIRIHFSGCPSSCGQHQIADIGLRGGQTRVKGALTESFDLFIGGKLGDQARFNYLVKSKILSADVHRSIERLIHYYQTHRLPDEPFHEFAQRIAKEQFKAVLESP